MNNKRERIYFFDYFRLIAFFMVFFVHVFQRYRLSIGQAFGIKDFYWVSIGGVAVSFFVILSGLTLTYVYESKRLILGEFFRRRIMRIYVPYFIVVALALVLLGLSPFSHGFIEYFLNFSGLLVFTGKPWATYFVSTGWFVGLIVSLYLLYPLLKKMFERYNINFVLVLLLIIEILSRYLVGKYMPGQRPLDWFPLCRVFELGLGIWLIKFKPTQGLIFRFRGIKALNLVVVYFANLSFHMYLVQSEVIKRLPNSESIYIFSFRAFLTTVIIAVFVMELEKLFYYVLSSREPKKRLLEKVTLNKV